MGEQMNNTQYRLINDLTGVLRPYLVEGMAYAEAVSTLRHVISMVKVNEAMGRDFTEEGPRHAA